MIKIEQPSMALNADDVPGSLYKMWNTWSVPSSDNIDHILSWVAVVCGGAPGGYLRMLIINCHGFYGSSGSGKKTGGFGLKLGNGIFRADTGKFSKLKGKVANIWITACGTARITNAGSMHGDGNLFCSEIAKNSGAYVVAATTHQVGDFYLPFGYIDDFEGLVVRYEPISGTVDWSKDYSRSTIEGLINGWE